jgi:hypothetical protein
MADINLSRYLSILPAYKNLRTWFSDSGESYLTKKYITDSSRQLSQTLNSYTLNTKPYAPNPLFTKPPTL